jgi:ribulose-phosphate 3-epimerase
MLRTVSIIPTLLSNNKQEYRDLAEKINAFSRRVQIDVTDNSFAQATTLDITNIWWPKNWEADLHFMAFHPSEDLDIILKLHPSLCILHAEAGEDLLPIFKTLKENDIKCGVALLPQTYPAKVKDYILAADHALIFAGRLGQQGSPADLMQMEKIPLIRNMKPEIEIGWDGGANMSNVRALAHADLDIINVGSAISKAEDPAAAYQALTEEIDKNGVVI